MDAAGQTLRLTCRLTRPDFRRVRRYLFPLHVRLGLLLGVMVLSGLILGQLKLPFPYHLLAVAGAVLACCLLFAWNQRRQFAAQDAAPDEAWQEVSDQGILLGSRNQKTWLAWDVFQSIVRDERFFLLRGGEQGGMPWVVLLKSGCSSEADWEQLQRLVARRFPPVVDAFKVSTAAAFRCERLPDERRLKGSAVLLLLGWVACCLILGLASQRQPGPDLSTVGQRATIFVPNGMLAAVAAATGVVAVGAFRLKAWSRAPLQMLSVLSLPLFPVGTILGLRILELLRAGPEPQLLTKDYEEIVQLAGPVPLAATPREPRRTHLVTWIVLVLFLLFVLSVVIAAMLSPPVPR
ncbi:hypothetical protein Pla8534_05310 [Lignipirellula cremea]|uniref:YcxB-like protein domain-containing protein n=2 Tax=Lignipirellula cremea TaxID=2528010 RepID=A0A518DLS2_9BACT|nr:hypothetical protein Pla8534_05310 [Lignipirellula cremea]